MGSRPRYLAEDERLVLEVRRHPAVLIGPVAAFLAVLLLASALGFVTSPGDGTHLIDVIAGLITLFVGLRTAWQLCQWWVDRILVTDHRIFEVSGLITRKIASIPITKVTDMTYRRSLLGRLIGYGDLIFETAGREQALDKLDHIPEPDDFYRTVTSVVAAKEPAPRRVVDKAKDAFDGDDDHASVVTKPNDKGRSDGDSDNDDESEDDEDTGPLPHVIV